MAGAHGAQATLYLVRGAALVSVDTQCSVAASIVASGIDRIIEDVSKLAQRKQRAYGIACANWCAVP